MGREGRQCLVGFVKRGFLSGHLEPDLGKRVVIRDQQ